MNRKCSVCRRRNVDLICNKCGNFICKRCYFPNQKFCRSCWKSNPKVLRWNYPKRLIIASFLIMIVLISTFLIMNINKVEMFTLFPLVLRGLGWSALLIITLRFLTIFALSMILPWLLAFKRSRIYWDEGIYRLNDNSLIRGSVMETIEYLITLEVPRRLKDSIFYEEEYGDLVITSKKDRTFKKTYSLPDYYLIDEIESQYEGNYLLLKLYLNKLPG